MATMRSFSGRSSIKALSKVVLPEPVPPDTKMFRRETSTSRALCKTRSGSEPISTRSWAEHARPPKRRTVMATCGPAGGTQMATREPSAKRESIMGLAAGSRPSGRAM